MSQAPNPFRDRQPFHLNAIICISHALSLGLLYWPLTAAHAASAVIVMLLCYPLAVISLQKNFRSYNKIYTGTAFFLGCSLGLHQFALYTTLITIGIVQTYAWSSQKRGAALKINGGLIIGMIAGWQLPSSGFSEQFSSYSTLVIILAAVLHLIYRDIGNQQKIRALQNYAEALKFDQRQLKLKSYKLSKYISPNIWRAIYSGQQDNLTTQRKKLTIFFSDIVGFTQISEELESEQLTELLNSYLVAMSDIALKHGATIDKFIGDAIMIFFGDPETKGPKEDCLKCVSMALEMKRRMKQLQLEWANQGFEKPLEIRMGINTGFCSVGNFGTNQRMDYTVLGREVNLASRLETAAGVGNILISHETYSLIKDVVLCRDQGSIRVKGFSQPVKVYEVANFRRELGKRQSYFEHRKEGFNMHLDLEKIKNYDKDTIITELEEAADKLRDKVII